MKIPDEVEQMVTTIDDAIESEDFVGSPTRWGARAMARYLMARVCPDCGVSFDAQASPCSNGRPYHDVAVTRAERIWSKE